MQPAAEVMGSDAGLHADQTRWHVRQPGSDLAACPSLAHDDRTGLPALPTDANYAGGRDCGRSWRSSMSSNPSSRLRETLGVGLESSGIESVTYDSREVA